MGTIVNAGAKARREAIAADYKAGMGVTELQRKYGVSRDTIRTAYQEAGLTSRRRGPAYDPDTSGLLPKPNTLRMALLERIATEPGETGPDIVAAVRGSSLDDLMWLNTRRYIAWSEPSRGVIRDVRLTKRGSRLLGPAWTHQHVGTGHFGAGRTGDTSDFRNHGSVAEGGPITRSKVSPPPAVVAKVTAVPPVVSPSTPKPPAAPAKPPLLLTPPEFPLLAALLTREEVAMGRALALHDAAQALDPGDPLRAQIIARGDAILKVTFTELELEYMAYAKSE